MFRVMHRPLKWVWKHMQGLYGNGGKNMETAVEVWNLGSRV